MRIAHFFIDRPIFSTVISIIIVLIGLLAYGDLPIEQYPQVVPPTIQVQASYPGANATTVAATVATPLEQEINGVEGMLYMDSQSTDDGQLRITVTFQLGTNLDDAQVLVQNRVAVAEARLPEEVRRIGITTSKNSPDLMLVVNLYSPNGNYDQTYIGNYAVLNIRDKLRRIAGVGEVRIVGATEYAMRIWLNPDLMNSFNISANDVLAAIRAQNIQIASGTLNAQPQDTQYSFEYNIQTQGRLVKKEEFENIIVKASEGRIVQLKDISRVELGAQDYRTRGYLGKDAAVALPIFQRPGTNALATAKEIMSTMEAVAKDFPPGLAYQIAYNPTLFVQQSINAVFHTIYEAVILVVLVILLFLQSWRAAIIPIVAIPISLIGTFAVMNFLGFSLNYLTLFGLVLAIGIVVDDAIVVIENMERNMNAGLKPRDAARKTMTEVGAALIAIGLVLIAVFMPTIFLQGISGRFYQQFGTTIAIATAISVFVSLTLSPTLATLLFSKHQVYDETTQVRWWKRPIQRFLLGFNHLVERTSRYYGYLVARLTRQTLIMMIAYFLLIILTILLFFYVPRGFIPRQDQGYFIVAVQLPPAASLSRTDAVMKQAVSRILTIPGIANTVSFTGFSGATFTSASNAGAIFTPLLSFEERKQLGVTYQMILANLRKELSAIKEAFIVVIPPPPVRGIGNAGGFKMMVQDREGKGMTALTEVANNLIKAANQTKQVTSVFTLFDNSTPKLFLDIDRDKALRLNIPYINIIEALQVYLGSFFVNEFNYLGRTFRVIAQAAAGYRRTVDDILRIKVRNSAGDMVPMGSIATINNTTGPTRIPHFNLYPAIEVQGDAAAGYSSDEALTTMENLAKRIFPDGIGYEWTEIAYQQKMVGNAAVIAFSLGVVFVFLVLAAQFESWTLPLAVILIVPMCLFSAMLGIKLLGMENNIMTQISFLVLVGLASKNAILIVEFAKQLEDKGANRWKAAIKAAKLRLRPILMTSLAFILGVFPLVIATGAGAEMRRAIGVAVFSGMIGVTFFGLIFTPIFYVLVSRFRRVKPMPSI